MKHLMILTAGVCLFLTSVPAMADQAADEAAIRKVREKRIATYNTKDLKIINDTVVEDYENWSGETKGREALIKKTHARLGEGDWKNLRIEQLEEIGIVFVTPDVAIFKSKQDYIGLLDEAGRTMPAYRVLFAEIYVKRNGKWLTHSWYWRSIEE